MVISPILRGMFGLEWNAPKHTLGITPHLPADWTTATLRRVPFGSGGVNLSFKRRGQELIVRATGEAASEIHLESRTAGAKAEGTTLIIPLPAAEVAVRQGLPDFGAETRQMKVLDEQHTARGLTLTLAAPASSRQTLLLRENAANLNLQTHDADIGPPHNGLRTVTILFPAGDGYVTRTVTLSW